MILKTYIIIKQAGEIAGLAVNGVGVVAGVSKDFAQIVKGVAAPVINRLKSAIGAVSRTKEFAFIKKNVEKGSTVALKAALNNPASGNLGREIWNLSKGGIKFADKSLDNNAIAFISMHIHSNPVTYARKIKGLKDALESGDPNKITLSLVAFTPAKRINKVIGYATKIRHVDAIVSNERDGEGGDDLMTQQKELDDAANLFQKEKSRVLLAEIAAVRPPPKPIKGTMFKHVTGAPGGPLGRRGLLFGFGGKATASKSPSQPLKGFHALGLESFL